MDDLSAQNLQLKCPHIWIQKSTQKSLFFPWHYHKSYFVHLMHFQCSFPKFETKCSAYALFQTWENHVSYLTTTKINTLWEATRSVMVTKLTRFTQKIAIPWHLVAVSCATCHFLSWWWVQELLDTPSYTCILEYGKRSDVKVPSPPVQTMWLCT